MTMREFIKEKVPNVQLNDEERRQWILNDENHWARCEGVRI